MIVTLPTEKSVSAGDASAVSGICAAGGIAASASRDGRTGLKEAILRD